MKLKTNLKKLLLTISFFIIGVLVLLYLYGSKPNSSNVLPSDGKNNTEEELKTINVEISESDIFVNNPIKIVEFDNSEHIRTLTINAPEEAMEVKYKDGAKLVLNDPDGIGLLEFYSNTKNHPQYSGVNLESNSEYYLNIRVSQNGSERLIPFIVHETNVNKHKIVSNYFFIYGELHYMLVSIIEGNESQVKEMKQVINTILAGIIPHSVSPKSAKEIMNTFK